MNDKAETAKMISESIEVMKQICDDWECDFLMNMKERVQKQMSLSAKQLNKLNEIYKKVCDSPY